MFFNGWEPLARVVVVGILAYIALIAILRISGKRTLAKMNAFDLIVTVALGSTLATVLLSRDVALAEGILAFGVLVLLQYAVAWLSVRSKKVSALVKSEPSLLFFQGQFLRQAMKDQRVVESEVWAAIRAQGMPSLDQVGGVVLETDGSFTVLPCGLDGEGNTLRYVAKAGQIAEE
jgi:uncharacterized membrane protein YcaP (DUF421 family)